MIIGSVQEALGSAKYIASSKLIIYLIHATTNLSLGNTFMNVMLPYTVLVATPSSKGRKIWWIIEGVPFPATCEINCLCKVSMRNRESFSNLGIGTNLRKNVGKMCTGFASRQIKSYPVLVSQIL